MLSPWLALVLALAKHPMHGRRPTPKSSAPLAEENGMLAISSPADIQITYATRAECIVDWFACECNDDQLALGFDTETRPSFRKGEVHPPATVQLSTATAVLVVHLLHLDAIPPVLVDILASSATLKVGVGVDDDVIELWLHHGLEVNGRLDLAHRPAATRSATKAKSLKGLAEELIGVRRILLPLTRAPPSLLPLTRTRPSLLPLTRTPPSLLPLTRTRPSHLALTRTPPSLIALTRTRPSHLALTRTPPSLIAPTAAPSLTLIPHPRSHLSPNETLPPHPRSTPKP